MGQPGTSAPGSDEKTGEAAADTAAEPTTPASATTEPAQPAPAANAATGGDAGATGPTERSADGAAVAALRTELAERVGDLQRVTAEYANYRKRVDRDRAGMAEQAIALLIGDLLPVLDDLDRARDHDDLVGPAAAMADQLNAVLSKRGLTAFGEAGDAFDPVRHEAVAHQTSADVTVPTCVTVMRRGYLLGERLLRPALVAVADPE